MFFEMVISFFCVEIVSVREVFYVNGCMFFKIIKK